MNQQIRNHEKLLIPSSDIWQQTMANKRFTVIVERKK